MWKKVCLGISWELQATQSQAVPIVGCRDGLEHLKVWFSPSPHQYGVLNYHVEEASAFLPDECDWFISPSLGCLMHFNMVENGHPFWTECSANLCLWIISWRIESQRTVNKLVAVLRESHTTYMGYLCGGITFWMPLYWIEFHIRLLL
jgi:hypothetical protein